MHPRLAELRAVVAARLRPRPKTRVGAWADAHRRLTAMSSPEPGPWRTSRVPYLDEILERMHPDDSAEWVVFRTGTQVGKTEFLLTILYFYMHQFPRPIAVVQPTDQACLDFSTQRVDEGIKASPEIRKLVRGQHYKDADGRRGQDAALTKKFLGGLLVILPATSKSALASKPLGILLLDEINRYPRELAGEPDPIGIVEHRSQNFTERKIALVSTPTDEGDSPIDDWYEKTDRRVFDLPCPECGVMQPLTFRKLPGVLGGVVWPEGRPLDACYECADCGRWISHDKKAWMLARGEWRATNPLPELANAHGYHLNALYSPFGKVTWGRLAAKFVRAQGDPVLMRDFVTLDLAEAWKPGSGQDIDHAELERRGEDGWGAGLALEVPGWVQVLTSFCDVQDDRLEVSVWGWSSAPRGCLIGHWILPGDPPSRGSAVWGELATLLLRQFRTPRGMLGIAAGGIDSGSGSHQDAVFHFVRSGNWQRRRQFATKGLASKTGTSDTRPIWPQKIVKKAGEANAVNVNVNLAKLHLSLYLAKPGVVAFPSRPMPALPPDYYEQLCSERLVRKADAAGRTTKTWHLRKGVRNEALDCAVGAYAAYQGIPRASLPLACGEREDLPANTMTAVAVPVVPRPPPPTTTPRKPPASGLGKDLWRRLRN